MKITVHDCEDFDVYAPNGYETNLKGKTIRERNGKLIEVVYSFEAPIREYAKEKGYNFNVCFYDKDKKYEEDISARYFCILTPIQKARVFWMYDWKSLLNSWLFRGIVIAIIGVVAWYVEQKVQMNTQSKMPTKVDTIQESKLTP